MIKHLHFGTWLLFLFAFGSVCLLNGQVDAPKDRAIVYYRDGSVFIGRIVAEDVFALQLAISTGDTIRVELNEARKVLRSTRDILVASRGKFFYTKGMFTSFGLGGGGGDDTATLLDLMIGRRIDEKYSVAVGTGLHYYSFFFGNFWADTQFIPVYGYGRYYLGRKNTRPFVFATAGYGFPSGTLFFGNFAGGFQGRLGVGINWASRKKLRWLLTLSQTVQNVRGSAANTDPFNNLVLYNYDLWLNRVVVKLGLEFR